jgi:hypothetical protein
LLQVERAYNRLCKVGHMLVQGGHMLGKCSLQAYKLEARNVLRLLRSRARERASTAATVHVSISVRGQGVGYIVRRLLHTSEETT